MPYLSSVPLNPLRRGAQRLIQNPQAMHAAVEGCLPKQRSGRLLWRLEVDERQAALLVLSPDMPSFEHIVEQAGWVGNEQALPRIADLEPLLSMISRGREFSFRTRVNPVQNVPHTGEHDVRGTKRGHRTATHQIDWFRTRTTGERLPWGFELAEPGPDEGDDSIATLPASMQLVERQRLQFGHGFGKPPVTIATATFEGRLRVTNADRFRGALLQGVGPSKAYGCGLLTLAAGHVVAR